MNTQTDSIGTPEGQSPVEPWVNEALHLFRRLDDQQKKFFIHWLRSTDSGAKNPSDLTPNRFWTEYYEKWKQGIDPFSAPGKAV